MVRQRRSRADSLETAAAVALRPLTANRLLEEGLAIMVYCNDKARADCSLDAATAMRGSEHPIAQQAFMPLGASLNASEWFAIKEGDEQVEFFEDLSAELAEVAYQAALGQGLGDRWLALRLALWQTLTESIATSDC